MTVRYEFLLCIIHFIFGIVTTVIEFKQYGMIIGKEKVGMRGRGYLSQVLTRPRMALLSLPVALNFSRRQHPPNDSPSCHSLRTTPPWLSVDFLVFTDPGCRKVNKIGTTAIGTHVLDREQRTHPMCSQKSLYVCIYIYTHRKH